MSSLRSVKDSLFAAKGLGLFPVVANSGWRARHLLILCYHGIAKPEEYESHDYMFLPSPMFDRRLAMLKDFGANVLELGDAVRRLQRGDLPPRSVAITFDDGWADFYVNAYPALRKYGFPATVYLTTYYCLNNRPVFSSALRHIMWKCRDQVIEGHGCEFLPAVVDLRSEHSRMQLFEHIKHYFKGKNLSGRLKDDAVAQFASVTGFDYEGLVRQRLFHLMNPGEVREVAAGGIDVQLHTHRHRTPLDRDLFIREISENRQHIAELTGKNDILHFCYPSGAHQPRFLPWLREAGVETATTCYQRYSSRQDDVMLLPRLLDQFLLSDGEFEAWLTGFMAFMPRRKLAPLEVAPE